MDLKPENRALVERVLQPGFPYQPHVTGRHFSNADLNRLLDAARAEAAEQRLALSEEDVAGLKNLLLVLDLPHARTCPARICDCDLYDTIDHSVRAARSILSRMGGGE